jgi:hypothetical protein
MGVSERLEYLRGEIRAERISWGEQAELQDLAEHIDPSDVELLEWAGVPEFPEDDDPEPEHRYNSAPTCAKCSGPCRMDP